VKLFVLVIFLLKIVLKKKLKYVAEDWEKSLKIAIITSTPARPKMTHCFSHLTERSGEVLFEVWDAVEPDEHSNNIAASPSY
jgi:hypothetical protein